MKKIFLALGLIFGGIQLSNAQFVALSSSNELPEFFSEYDSHDSVYQKCLQSWATNYEWSECNGEELQYWQAQMQIGYSEVMARIDSSAKNDFKSYHKAWLNNIEAQELLFDKLRKDAFSGREQIISFGGVIARQYAEHAKDLRYLAYVLSLK